jgi:hypothetical protein
MLFTFSSDQGAVVPKLVESFITYHFKLVHPKLCLDSIIMVRILDKTLQ